MLPFLWATSFFQKITMSLQKYPNWQKIIQSGHPASLLPDNNATTACQIPVCRMTFGLKCYGREPLLRGKAHYDWPPCHYAEWHYAECCGANVLTWKAISGFVIYICTFASPVVCSIIAVSRKQSQIQLFAPFFLLKYVRDERHKMQLFQSPMVGLAPQQWAEWQSAEWHSVWP